MLNLNETLARKRLRGDPLADQLVFDILGEWDHPEILPAEKSKLVQQLIRYIRGLRCNGDLDRPQNRETFDPRLLEPLDRFFSEAKRLPPWADLEKIKKSEDIFRENGVLACLLFFCASLPEVYLIPDISAVLNVTGQLENATEQRIRATATMILSVLLDGGQTSDDGIGVVLTLRARLIHALIRYLLVRNDPMKVTEELLRGDARAVTPQDLGRAPTGMFEALSSAGWDLEGRGMPCNQEEMAYTLLTFNYVFIRSLRRFGLKLSSDDEIAYLHAWNVVGHFMGVDHELLAFEYDHADELFLTIQNRAKETIVDSKVSRSGLGEALMAPIEKSIPIPKLKPFARLITEFLTSAETVEGLGIHSQVKSKHRTFFNFTMKSALRADRLAPKLKADLSLVRFTIRVAGYQLLSKVLIDPTKPLDLPDQQVAQVRKMLGDWSTDPKAPKWLNKIEDIFTTRGTWEI